MIDAFDELLFKLIIGFISYILEDLIQSGIQFLIVEKFTTSLDIFSVVNSGIMVTITTAMLIKVIIGKKINV